MANNFTNGHFQDIWGVQWSKLNNLDDETLMGFKDRGTAEQYLQSNDMWAYSGMANPSNEKIVDGLLGLRDRNQPLWDQQVAAKNEVTLAAATAEQAKARAEQRTKLQAAQGRRGTLLTAPLAQNPATPDPSLDNQRKTLIGQ